MRNAKMKNFISVHDVTDIDALVQKALACKANPFSEKKLGLINALVVCF